MSFLMSEARLHANARCGLGRFAEASVSARINDRNNAFTARRSGRKRVCVSLAKNMEISVIADEGMPPLKQVFPVSESSKLYTASLRKPLGLTLAEQGGKIVVETVAEEGNGSRAEIKVGDVVRGTTARSKNTQQTTATTVEARNKQSFLGGVVLMNADEESFDTVIAAIQSSKCATCDVTLVLERPGQK